MRLLLSEPNPDDGLLVDVSNQFKFNKSQFEQTAREITKQYATKGAWDTIINIVRYLNLELDESLTLLRKLKYTQKIIPQKIYHYNT